ncbi:gfo/Idh/MocA family oxidoreductase [Paenibacillus nanensis]|uniref:Gfo/Idh/MocA family oxidoreductase n=1 Tax=Paenibacillus nanensis TaxID=393251 RepID=A0A3A1UJH4_9BACL|nr:Gfo/Idh/MocA family oxidoreductase [Paenibacillus nanensis]RIX47272.1 gfo/Idh/MocA family oxidoreductase [Paenibacillus nanensis]
MLKVGLIGFGFMGRMHFDNYVRLMKEGANVRLAAICDTRIDELKNVPAAGNIATEQQVYDLSPFQLYDDIDKMLENEELDIVDITLPTTLHADIAISLMKRGIHVLCEKPIARTSEEAYRMVEASKETGKTLMIGQCLRFWPAYEYLKECVTDGRYGKVTSGYFFRGGATPEGWFRNGELSGGCMLDMHIHDTDVVNWLFGKPEAVSTLARNVVPGSAYDIVSTNYMYPDGKVLNAQADWTLQGDFGFAMTFRVNFEGGNLVFENDRLKVNPNEGLGFYAELPKDMGYYREIRYFLQAVSEGKPVEVCTPDSAAASLEIVEAEIRSANNRGAIERL